MFYWYPRQDKLIARSNFDRMADCILRGRNSAIRKPNIQKHSKKIIMLFKREFAKCVTLEGTFLISELSSF